MRFRVIKPTYINEAVREVGEEVNIDVERLAKNHDGSVNMAKHTSLEPLEDFPDVVKKVAEDGERLSPPAMSADERAKLIVGAVNGLLNVEDSHWTQGGKPSLKAIELAIGFQVTREEVESLVPNARRENPMV